MPSPDHVVRVRNIYVALFLNASMKEGKVTNAPKISIKSKYSDATGGVRYTASLYPNEIPYALIALQKMFDWCSSNLGDSSSIAATNANED